MEVLKTATVETTSGIAELLFLVYLAVARAQDTADNNNTVTFKEQCEELLVAMVRRRALMLPSILCDSYQILAEVLSPIPHLL